MGDRYSFTAQLEHLQMKYTGTGHSDLSKFEWVQNQHRDTYSSFIGHYDLLTYFSVAENESAARIKYNFLTKMTQPCGPPPPEPVDAEIDELGEE